MTPFTLASFLTLALIPSGQALVRFRTVADNCGDNCRAEFGWPGHPFPNDPWGLVMDPNLMSIPTSSVATIPTDSANPNGAGGVEASPSSRSDIVYTGFRSLSPSISSPSSGSSSTPSSVSNFSTSSPSSTSKPSNTEVSSLISPTSPLPTSSTAPSPSSPQPLSTSPQLPSTASQSPSASPSPTSSSISNASSGIVNAGSDPSNGSSASTSSPGPSIVGSDSTSGPASQSDIQAYLDGHNTVRAQHGAAPLTYSQDLATKAQQWADGCVFKHSGGQLGPFGENLAAGTGSGYGIPQAIQSWTDEASQYNAGNPQPSHFTQVVWKGTTQVGCALQNCDGIFPSSFGQAHFYVCEYSPQGNIIGEFGANVQA